MSVPPRLWIACAGLAAILVGGYAASGALEQLFLALPGIDKVAHVIFHCALFICVHAMVSTSGAPARLQSPIAAVAVLAVAVIDEVVQSIIPSRSVELEDLVAGAAGLSFGWVLTAKPTRAQAIAVTAAATLAAVSVTTHTYLRMIDYSRGLRYSRQQDLVTARTYFQRARAAGLRTPGLYNELGWVEIESGVGDPVKAVEYAKTALDMQPQNPDILDTYGWALHHAGRSREALDALLAASARNPDIYNIHYHLAQVYLTLGRTTEAETHFRDQLKRTNTREAQFARQALDRMAEHR
jgi:Tfp pilus assembly protein PilF